ncbi:unnamed protein product [Brassica rapa subsp. narinosa]
MVSTNKTKYSKTLMYMKLMSYWVRIWNQIKSSSHGEEKKWNSFSFKKKKDGSDLLQKLKNEELSINDAKLSPQELAELIAAIKDGTISGKVGKQLLAKGGTVQGMIKEKDLITDPVEMEKMVMKVFSKSPKQLEQYRSGRTKLQGFFCWPGNEAVKRQSKPCFT